MRLRTETFLLGADAPHVAFPIFSYCSSKVTGDLQWRRHLAWPVMESAISLGSKDA